MTKIGFLHLEIFCFDPRADYEFYFKKHKISYTHAKPSGEQISTSQTLGEILESISSTLDICVDTSVGLKINGIALLGDNISDELSYKASKEHKEILSKETSSKETLDALLERFGNEWRIEPLSTLYVKKDLTLDLQAMHSKYEEFFDKHHFITQDERKSLSKYLPLNLISTRDDDYLGDGFFLFVKWLAQKHSEHLDDLLESISDTKNGVLSYSSIQNLLYKPNPQIDRDIEWLINALLAQRKEISQTLVKNSKKDFDDTSNLAKSNASTNTMDSTKGTTYILFDGYESSSGKESSELITSCQKLCEKLEIPLANKSAQANISFAYNGGHFTRITDFDFFIKCTLENILQANARGYTLLFGDYASFCEARLALQMLAVKSKNEIKDFMANTKEKIHSMKEPIAYIGDLLKERLHTFAHSDESSALSVVSFISNTTSALESTLNETSYIERIQGVFDALNQGSKKIVLKSFIAQDFSHLAHLNEQCYLEESAKIRFAGIDEGADLLLVDSIEQFRAFDTQAKSSAKAYGRDIDSTKAVFLPSLVLLVLEEILGAESKQKSKAV
ncbi:DUF5644 domain-containing protein [Helicobacter macacae]|uniref:Uncharacterized protein n=1 Tax=Helicobacter macacae MIT 99-5501 TaxID=1357400 RepID=V8CCS8_9HELI|nr:DUF5644 domain-containing protein [Helicobacter macacae]ETD24907.1 hypothetical protein HMPREF2086_00241 [Helicobacter macacae MIT 99-5501]